MRDSWRLLRTQMDMSLRKPRASEGQEALHAAVHEAAKSHTGTTKKPALDLQEERDFLLSFSILLTLYSSCPAAKEAL